MMFVKIGNPLFWRNWPVPILYFPLALYVFSIGALRTRRFFYFSAANPRVSLGGFAGDSKNNILEKIPHQYKPKSVFISNNNTLSEVISQLSKSNISFPIIAKPDLGESGFLVKKISSKIELISYYNQHQMDFILQEFIEAPLELSILIHCWNNSLIIQSITERVHFHVIGDGVSTLKSLILKNPQGRNKFKQISFSPEIDLNIIPPKNEVVFPNSIGNWDFGATYYERNNMITPLLVDRFNEVNQKIGLFEYARIDLKCKSFQNLEKGEFKILEINGVKGEPIHIYDRKYSLFKAYQEIFKQWEIILKISNKNIKNGFEVPSIWNCIKTLNNHVVTKKKSLKPRLIHEQD